MHKVTERLVAAIGTGEVVSIRYHGGSKPGAAREIMPLQVFTSHVSAKCMASKVRKDFKLALIEVLDQPVGTETANLWSKEPIAGSAQTHHTIAAVFEALGPMAEAKGWHAAHECHEYGERFCLYKRKKDGSRLKYPSIELAWTHTTFDSSVAESGESVHTNFRPRERPWSVRNKQSLGSWRDSTKAVEIFVQVAGLRD